MIKRASDELVEGKDKFNNTLRAVIVFQLRRADLKSKPGVKRELEQPGERKGTLFVKEGLLDIVWVTELEKYPREIMLLHLLLTHLYNWGKCLTWDMLTLLQAPT